MDPKRLIFLDESGIDTRMVRAYARAAAGRRAVGKVPWGHWKRLTVLGALATEGVLAAMSVAGPRASAAATSTRVFLAFVEHVLIPAVRQWRPDAIVVMDNLAAHKAKAVRAMLDRAGIEYRYLPSYSPDLVWGFACQALTIAAPPSSAACSRSMTGDDDRRGACLGARGVAPQPCIRSAHGEAGP